MTRLEKKQEVENLTQKLGEYSNVYLADASTLTVETINKFRQICFDKGVTFKVVKNTLLKKAMEQAEGDYSDIYDTLSGPTSILLSETANLPAKVLKKFREDFDKPELKAAYIDSSVYIGDDQIKALSELKSKEELIGEIIGLLQSPAKNVISALQAGGSNLASILQTLSEKES